MRLINVDKAIEDIGDGVYTGSKIRRWLKSLPSAVQPELAQCCGDIISRQAAIDTLKELTANGTNKGMIFGEDAVHRIEMLPSVQPEQRWIPCSERLPEKEGWYITTVESEKTGKRRIENDLFAVDIALAHGHTPNKFCKDGYRQRTVAWMPFPEPYCGGEEE